MKAGTGYCNEKNAFVSGRTVAESAMRSGEIEKPCLVIVFCGGQVDANEFFRGLQSITSFSRKFGKRWTGKECLYLSQHCIGIICISNRLFSLLRHNKYISGFIFF
jgi:hypothetical protein